MGRHTFATCQAFVSVLSDDLNRNRIRIVVRLIFPAHVPAEGIVLRSRPSVDSKRTPSPSGD